jgi:hypothetical protein
MAAQEQLFLYLSQSIFQSLKNYFRKNFLSEFYHMSVVACIRPEFVYLTRAIASSPHIFISRRYLHKHNSLSRRCVTLRHNIFSFSKTAVPSSILTFQTYFLTYLMTNNFHYIKISSYFGENTLCYHYIDQSHNTV